MRTVQTALPGVLLIEPQLRADARGYFREVWQRERYAAAGVSGTFVQDNVSFSHAGVLRGLHLQHPLGQGKLVSVIAGEVFDVAVDVRRGSPTFARWVGYALSAESGRQLYIPPGFAHGFAVARGDAIVAYKVSAAYDAASDLVVAWDDPAIGVEWPVASPTLSDRDRRAARLGDIPADRLPLYAASGEP